MLKQKQDWLYKKYDVDGWLHKIFYPVRNFRETFETSWKLPKTITHIHPMKRNIISNGIYFSNDTEFIIFLIWALYVSVFFLNF